MCLLISSAWHAGVELSKGENGKARQHAPAGAGPAARRVSANSAGAGHRHKPFVVQDMFLKTGWMRFVVDMPEDDRLERMNAFAGLVVIAPEGRPHPLPDDIGRKTLLAFQGGCACRTVWSTGSAPTGENRSALRNWPRTMPIVKSSREWAWGPCRTRYCTSAALTSFPYTVWGIPCATPPQELIWRKGMLSANMTALRQCLRCTRHPPLRQKNRAAAATVTCAAGLKKPGPATSDHTGRIYRNRASTATERLKNALAVRQPAARPATGGNVRRAHQFGNKAAAARL